MRLFTFLSGLLGLAATALGQACSTTTAQAAVPTVANVSLHTYNYCGGTLNTSVYIANLCYNKVVKLYYANENGESTPVTVIALGYDSSIPNTNYESWTASVPISFGGISELLNLTYQAVDISETYDQVLNLKVVPSGAPPPGPPSLPEPYARPSGFSKDISKWLAAHGSGSEIPTAFERMFLNISPDINGAVNGSVVAARSGPSYAQKEPDYEYTWVRDTSLTFEVVKSLYAAASKKPARSFYEELIFAYSDVRAHEQIEPGLQTGLGEPKFYLNNTIFTGPWGRPQNDGPATSAITLIEFANAYLANGGSVDTVRNKIYDSNANPASAPVMKDLLFVASNWTYPSFGIWEEVEADHFYDRLVQRKALVLGAAFAKKMGDSVTASTLSSQIPPITASLDDFWDPDRAIIVYEYGPVYRGKTSYLDSAVLLGIQHGYADDGVYAPTNERVLSTAVRLATSFIDVYPIANSTQDAAGRTLGIPVGRYPEDTYNGVATTGLGNPWYLTTATMAQLMYTLACDFSAAGSLPVTSVSESFWSYFAPGANLKAGKTYGSKDAAFKTAIAALQGWGDAFMRTVMYYTPADGHLSEEFDRATGAPMGAADLTWSYASLLTAAMARAEAMGNKGKNFDKQVANLGPA